MSEDPWKHRSEGMRCRTCVFYVIKKAYEAAENGKELGRCRATYPTMKGFPAVFPDDWCGYHRLDETKI